MENYKVLETSGTAPTETSRPNVVGTKRALKKEHGSIAEMTASYLRFMVTQWDIDYNTPPQQGTGKSRHKLSRVEEIKENYRYYQSQQRQQPYGYLTEGSEGEELPAPYSNGNEIYQVVQHMVGPVYKHFAATTITIESLDPSVQSKRSRKVAMLEAKKKMPRIFEQMQGMGIGFMPEGAQGQTSEDFDKAIRDALRNPADNVERYGMDILNHVNNTNSIKHLMPKCYKDVVIGTHDCVHVTSSNGRIVLEKVSPWCTFFDRDDQDDDFNRYSLFKGFISWKTKEEIYQTYKLGDDAREEIDKMFDSNASTTITSISGLNEIYGGYNGFNWLESEGTRRIACVTGYFIASITDGKDEYYNTLYEGTLIGNSVIVNYGESNNISYDMARPEWPVIPIHVYSPDTIMGQNVCPVDRFRQIQSDCDAMLYKIRGGVGRDLGKGYVFYSDSAVPKDIIEDLKNFGVTVVNRADPEEPIINNNKLVDVVDMTLDPNIITYVNLRKELKQDMKDVVSQTNITQGLQQTYIGGGTQQATIAQAGNGTVAMMSGFFQHFAFIEQHVLNTAKIMLLDAKNEHEASLILSDASASFWKSVRDLGVPDLQVRVEMEDYIDEERRARYQQYALAMAQNAKETGFNMLDALTIENGRTAEEVYSKLKESLEMKEKKAEREAQQNNAMQQQMMAQQQQMDAMKFQMEEQGKAYRDQLRNAPKHEENEIKREKLNLERNMEMRDEMAAIDTPTNE